LFKPSSMKPTLTSPSIKQKVRLVLIGFDHLWLGYNVFVSTVEAIVVAIINYVRIS